MWEIGTLSLAEHDTAIIELHRQGYAPQKIAEALAEIGVEAEPGAVYERIVWLTMPRAHSSA